MDIIHIANRFTNAHTLSALLSGSAKRDSSMRSDHIRTASPDTVSNTSDYAGNVSYLRDSVRLNDENVLTAERDGYMEINGVRVMVPENLRDAIRQAYDTAAAYNRAIAMRNDIISTQRTADQQTKILREQADALKKAMEIYRRIAKGGRVPPQDEKFLMEYSQTMYMAAKMEAMMAKKHEKYDSVLEDEEEDDNSEEITEDDSVYHAEVSVDSGGDTPSVDGVTVSVESSSADALM